MFLEREGQLFAALAMSSGRKGGGGASGGRTDADAGGSDVRARATAAMAA